MSKRKVDDKKLREIVRYRMTKGEAFSLNHEEYTMNQRVVRAYLATLSREEIFGRYPEYTYDLR